jgi:hypothetical protein
MPGLTTDVMSVEGPFGEFEVDVSFLPIKSDLGDRLV